MSRWASWLRMDGGLKCPWFLVHKWSPSGESVRDRVLAWGGSAKDLDRDGSGFPRCLPVLERACITALWGSGQREGAVLSWYRPDEQDSLEFKCYLALVVCKLGFCRTQNSLDSCQRLVCQEKSLMSLCNSLFQEGSDLVIVILRRLLCRTGWVVERMRWSHLDRAQSHDLGR